MAHPQSPGALRRACFRWAVLGAVGLGAPGVAQAEPPFAEALAPGGQLRGVAFHVGDPWGLGYWEWIPASYDPDDPDQRFPLAIYLHGLGPARPETWCIDPATGDVDGTRDVCPFVGCGTTTNGLCAMRSQPVGQVANGGWDHRPFITIFPQIRSANIAQQWSPTQLQLLLDHLLANYPVDPRRVYIFGLSQGGRGALQFVAGNDRQITAVSISPGGGVDADATCRFQDTALWAFHGENDQEAALGQGVFSPCTVVRYLDRHQHPSIAAVQYPTCAEQQSMPYPPGRMTMFRDRAHNVWDPVIFNPTSGFNLEVWADDETCNSTTEFTTAPDPAVYPDGIYSWLMTFDRPETSAGDDFEVAAEAPYFELVATTVDDDPITYTWTQTGGAPVTIDDGQDPPQVVGFAAEQSYTFEVLAVDADLQWDRDEVTVTIAPAVVGGSDSDGTGGSTGDTTSGDTDDSTTGTTDGSTTEAATTGDPADTSGTASESSTGTGADGTSSEAGSNSASGGDSTSGADGTTTGNDTTETNAAGSGPPATSAGGENSDLDAGDPARGCACTTDPRSRGAGGTAWLLVLMAGLRRRR